METHTQSAINFSPLWNRTYGGFDQDRFYGMTQCEDGGYAFVGYAQSFGTDEDLWVVRTDSNGDVLWTTVLSEAAGHDIGREIIECENGDLVVVGYSYPTGDNHARIDRIDRDGNVVWSKLIGEVPTQDFFEGVVESKSGCLLAVGRTESWGAGGNDVLAVCFDPNGNEIWIRTFGGAADDSGISVVECASGGYAILGETMSFGEGSYDFWLLRIDNDGNLLWDETYGGTDTDYGYEIIEYSAGGFVMAGSTESLGDPQGDFWAIMVDDSGTEVWNETYVGSGQDFATGIVESVRGGFAIVGVSDFISGTDQVRITRIDIDGSEIWSSWYGGPDVDYGYGIEEVHPEEFVVGGTTRSYGSGSFDGWTFLVPGEPVLDNPPTEGFFDYGELPYFTIPVYSTATIDSAWITGSYSSVYAAIPIGYDEVHVYTFDVPDVGFYDLYIHINNTAGHEIMHTLWIYVDDRTAPHWLDPIEHQTLEYGDALQYALRADDLSGLNKWSLTGSDAFSIDSNGEITNVGTPDVGEYSITVSVEDVHGNVLTDDLRIVVQDTIAPQWTLTLQDQTINHGSDFVYDLSASDLAGISSWWVDNSEFSVDWEGRVRNIVPLAPGEHGVTVFVSDVNGNILQGQFTVTVGNPSTTPTTGGEPPGILESALPFGAGVAATVAVVAVVCAMGRRRTPT
ncbi:MAG: hypothetical protein ACXACG_01425 [Candidatus Thorarchaeota archaeon]